MSDKANYQFLSSTQEAWDAMFEAICNARKSIYWELYIFNPDEIGLRFVRILKEKAQAGVEVKLIFDAFGSFSFSEKLVQELREAGAEVIYFNPLKMSNFWRGIRKYFERTHRKILIIDQEIGFIGSVNVEGNNANWFDLQVKVTGSIVRRLLHSFSHSYLAGGGLLNRIKHIFYLPIIKEKYWSILYHKPRGDYSIIRKVYLNWIRKAKKSLTLVSPYFLPDQDFLQALREARKRGVEIDLIVPWKTDHPTLTHAMRAYWRAYDLLGFRIHLVKKMLHAKAMMVDDKWAMVGSSNFDSQTFYRNYEANIIFSNKQMVEDFRKVLHHWKDNSRLFHISKWEKRSVVNKVYEFFCKLLRPFL